MPLLGRVVDTVLDRTVVPGYLRTGYQLRTRLPGWPADPPPGALRGRTAVVTGANSGLGKATAAGLAGLGARVHLVVRDVAKGERAAAEIAEAHQDADLLVARCDVSDLADVRRFAAEYRGQEAALDVLVHNAGAMSPTRTESPQGHELSLATHVLGPMLLTELARPVLRAAGAGRVVLVSSGGMYAQKLYDTDPEFREGRYRPAVAYARTKRMQVALTPVLAATLAGDGIAVYATHPGWADTPGVVTSLPVFHRLTGPLLRDAEQGADTAVWLAAADPAPPTGLFWHDRRPRPAHYLPFTRETDAQRDRLWAWCREQLDEWVEGAG